MSDSAPIEFSPSEAADIVTLDSADVVVFDSDVVGNVAHISGTTTITRLYIAPGVRQLVRFTGALILTHGANLVLPGAADITTAAGDYAEFIGYDNGLTRCSSFQRASGVGAATSEAITVSASDETTDLTTGAAKVSFRMPFAMTLTAVRGSLSTAATGGTLFSFDVNEAGVSVFSTTPTFTASSKTTVGAVTPAVISDSALADDALITVDIDAIGSTLPGKGLKVTLIGNRA